MPHHMPFFLSFAALLLVTCLLAVRVGDKWDRIAATIFVSALGASFFADMIQSGPILSLNLPLAAIDLMVFIALFALAMFSGRFWPLWATAFQLATVLTHLAIYVQPGTEFMAYLVSLGIWSFPTVGALLWSLILRWRTARSSISANSSLE